MNMGMGMNMGGGMQQYGGMPATSYNMLAHEFGVEPDVVAALAQRLAFAGNGPAQGMGMQGMTPAMGYVFGNGRM